MRLIRQMLTESLLLAFAGGVTGLLMAGWGTKALLRLAVSARTSESISVTPDARVFAFTAAVCLVTGLLFGLAPALRSSRVPVGPTLKEGALGKGKGGRFSLGKVLVVLQVSVCLLVLFAAGLFFRNRRNMKKVDLRYSKEHILMAPAPSPAPRSKPVPILHFP